MKAAGDEEFTSVDKVLLSHAGTECLLIGEKDWKKRMLHKKKATHAGCTNARCRRQAAGRFGQGSHVGSTDCPAVHAHDRSPAETIVYPEYTCEER